MMMLMADKQAMRKEMLARRNAMTSAEAESKSSVVARNLAKMKEYKKSKAVLFYAEKGNEVRTEKLIIDALKSGKRVMLPITDTAKQELTISEIRSPDDLKEGPFGIMEPIKKVPVNEAEIDLIIVPGVAFDEQCHRLGYGHGYYDKLLQRLRKTTRIGLAYDLQVIDNLPVQNHDQKMDMIVTEKMTIIKVKQGLT